MIDSGSVFRWLCLILISSIDLHQAQESNVISIVIFREPEQSEIPEILADILRSAEKAHQPSGLQITEHYVIADREDDAKVQQTRK